MTEEGKLGKHARNLMILGYRDYIAARFLLNNDFLIQGITFASTAVEKYLKVLLLVAGKKRKLHLENWKEIKNLLHINGIDIFNDLDINFLKLLSKVYKLRYYDKIENQVNYGFIKWQALGELDFAINIIENRTTLKLSSGDLWKSPYKAAVEVKEQALFEENYILNGIDKKEYMEREGKYVVLNIDMNLDEFLIEGPLKQENYEGSIIELKDFRIT
jgi:hypothetical protein